VAKKPALVNPDKRSRLDLELFVLALIQRGINTPYGLRASVGLSPGGTIPALNRLTESGFLRRGKPGARGRAEYEVTPSGSQHLRSAWRQLLNGTFPTDVDAILRIASLTILSGADRRRVAAYLRRAAAARVAESRHLSRENISPTGFSHLPSNVGLYAWMQAVHATSRLASEAQLLRLLARTIPSNA
jgi:DNA-binding PadR family transcriptional regulator